MIIKKGTANACLFCSQNKKVYRTKIIRKNKYYFIK